jgi:hypothetical protein
MTHFSSQTGWTSANLTRNHLPHAFRRYSLRILAEVKTVWHDWDFLAVIINRHESMLLGKKLLTFWKKLVHLLRGMRVSFVKVKVKNTLRLAVYRQSVHLGAKLLEDNDQRFFLQLNPCGQSPYVISSLTTGWVCFLWIGFASLLSSVHIAHMAWYWEFFVLHYIKFICQSRLCKTDHAYLTYPMLQRQLSQLNGRKPNGLQV